MQRADSHQVLEKNLGAREARNWVVTGETEGGQSKVYFLRNIHNAANKAVLKVSLGSAREITRQKRASRLAAAVPGIEKAEGSATKTTTSILMKRAPGRTVYDICRTPISSAEGAFGTTNAGNDLFLTHLLAALQSLHMLGVSHGDLNAKNILYEVSSGSLTIIDLGAAAANAGPLVQGVWDTVFVENRLSLTSSHELLKDVSALYWDLWAFTAWVNFLQGVQQNKVSILIAFNNDPFKGISNRFASLKEGVYFIHWWLAAQKILNFHKGIALTRDQILASVNENLTWLRENYPHYDYTGVPWAPSL